MTDFISTKPQMTSALDFAGLAEMRAGAVHGKEQVTKEVAQQFEAIFINMMLKSMRDATERSGLLDSQATKTYESMFDQQLSTDLAGQGTFGIAQALQNQLNGDPREKSATGFLPLGQQRGLELRQSDLGYELKRSARPAAMPGGEQ